MLAAEFVVSVAKAGAAPVAPMHTWPLVPTANEVRLPDALPRWSALLVVPDTLIVAAPPRDTGDPVMVILLPLFIVILLLVRAALGTVPKKGSAPVLPR